MSNDYTECSQHVTFDTETTGLDPRSDELRLVCFKRGAKQAKLRHPEHREQIQKWLEQDCLYFAHNATFDWSFLDHNGYKLPPEDKWRETQLAVHFSGRRMPGEAKLDRLAKKFVSEGDLPEWYLKPEEDIKKWLSKARRKATKEGWDYTPQKGHAPYNLLEPYCMADVEITQYVAQRCGSEIKEKPDILALEHRVIPAIYHTQERGAPVDMRAARIFQVDVEKGVNDWMRKVKEIAGDPEFNPQATRQIEEVLRNQGVDVDSLPKTPKSGRPSLKAEVLETIDHPLAQSIIKLREEKKLVDYAAAIFKFSHDGRLYGTFRQVGTGTGRMSSGEPNLQNLPTDKRVRGIFRAVGNKILVGADFDNMELRMLARLAPGGGVEAAIKEGQDMHQTAADGVGLTRQQGKTLNYSILYGAGVNKVSMTFGVSHARAAEILDLWYKTFPEVHELKEKIRKDLESYGYIETLMGRQHHIEADRHYIGLNYMIQGSCADIFKLAAAVLHERGLPAILYVHDEIVLEVDEDDQEDARDQLEDIMVTAGGDAGMVAEASVGKQWSELK